MPDTAWLDELNPQQRAAAAHGDGPLLIIAGAGAGKTKTLAANGHDPCALPHCSVPPAARERFGALCELPRYYATKHELSDRHTLAQLTRFIPADVRAKFDQVTLKLPRTAGGEGEVDKAEADARAKIREQ